jgi:hypothetical protein
MRYVIGIFVLAACSTDDALVAGFTPPPAPAGYTRMVAPAVHDIQPGDDLNNCQWLADPSDDDRQVVDMKGFQSLGGHHFTLYATKIHEKVGTTRICTQEDMLAITFLGAVGGEGNGSNVVHLPDGLAFDLPKGTSLMANAHYINATDNVIDAQSVVDVKFGDPAHPLAPVGFIAVDWEGFKIPATNTNFVSDAKCTASQKLSFFMWGNHLHEYGVEIASEIIRSDGTVVPRAHDMGRSPEQTFNTPWVKWDPSTPMVVNPGDQFHVTCTWKNTTTAEIDFPREMCVATGFVLEAMPQSVCEAQ